MINGKSHGKRIGDVIYRADGSRRIVKDSVERGSALVRATVLLLIVIAIWIALCLLDGGLQ